LDGKVPETVRTVHEQEVEFVKQWMVEWRGKGRWKTGPDRL
jgi:hypothetical protein